MNKVKEWVLEQLFAGISKQAFPSGVHILESAVDSGDANRFQATVEKVLEIG
jgi:hypothetical protein